MNESKNEITITVLMENRTSSETLCCEHGLSFHIRTPECEILFDTGQSGNFAKNAETLGIDLNGLNALVFSHGHYDHTDGLPALQSKHERLNLYVHPEAGIERYSIKDPANPRYIGICAASRQEMEQCKIHPVTAPTRVDSWVTCTGPVPRENDFEDTGGPFFLDKAAQKPDPIVDDQSLIIRTEAGLVLLLGCAHSGVINTLRYCQHLNPGQSIHAIIGGFHLLNATDSRLQQTYDILKGIGPDILAPCHCTGERPMQEIETLFPDRFMDCRTGSRFTFVTAPG